MVWGGRKKFKILFQSRKTGIKYENNTQITLTKWFHHRRSCWNINEMKNYYKILYTRVETKNKHEEFFNDLWGPKFEDNHKDRAKNEITEDEILNVLKNTSKNKAPGEDGLPSEFYKVFWIDIKRYLIKSYQHSYSTGMLSITQRRGVISLIPKKKDPLNLKNWRPLSLLNQDYKLLAKLKV